MGWLTHSLVLVLVGLAFLIIAYNQYVRHQRDIHEIALNQQADISPSRKENESAIYRNNQTPHGMPLLTGLQIRHGFRLRNGNLRDIWSVVMGQKNRDARLTFVHKGEEVVCGLDNLNAVFKRFSTFFKQNEWQRIGIAVPVYTYHGFVTCMACYISGLTVHAFTQLPRSQHDIDILVVDESQLKYATMFTYKKVIVISSDSSKSFDDSNIINWGEIGDLEALKDDVFEYKYDASYDDILPLVDTANFQTTSYTHQNFVSSIASVIRSLPLGHEFGQEKLLIGYQDSTMNYWPKTLAILLCGGSVVLGSTRDETFEKNITTYRPTVISLDAQSAKSFFLCRTDFGIFHSLMLHRAVHLFSQGVFSTSAMRNSCDQLKLIYIGDDNKGLASEELTTIRALYGCRVVAERFKSGVLGPVLSTNYYDYRIFSNKRLINRGAAPLPLEIKLFKYKNLDIGKRHGELCIRGFTIGRPVGEKELERAIASGERVGSEGWMPTGIIGKFGTDGCFYEDQ
jgi:hypothetical protein